MFAFALSIVFVATAQAVEFQFTNKWRWFRPQSRPKSNKNWAGRFWGRTGCNPDTNHCETGDCGNKLQCNGSRAVPPVSLAEITLKSSGGLDFYDITLSDGFNIKISMEPVEGSADRSKNSCKRCACSADLLGSCPNELKVNNDQGTVVACNSACGAFNTDEYCCRGRYNTPEDCQPPVKYLASFKKYCPDAYSYPYADYASTFTCKAKKYIITFG